jgi:predicted O-methyltransferase YrrM
MPFSFLDFRRETKDLTKFTRNQQYGINLNGLESLIYRIIRRLWQLFYRSRLLDSSDATNPLLYVAAPLRDEHLTRCRVFASRESMLRSFAKRKVWAEVGTYEGAFARQIEEICAPVELNLIDMDFSRLRLKRYVTQGDIVRFHEGASNQILSSFPDEYFDCIYIDANHDLSSVAKDVDVARSKIKSDGLLIFNDYIIFSHADMAPYGTVPVVNALCNEDNWEMVAFVLQAKMYCDVALRRRSV